MLPMGLSDIVSVILSYFLSHSVFSWNCYHEEILDFCQSLFAASTEMTVQCLSISPFIRFLHLLFGIC